VRPVARVRSDVDEPADRRWGDVTSTIELDDAVPDEAITGLGEFSHVEVVFYADRADGPAPWSRRPRDDERWPVVGVFANRAKDRPNHILTSVVQVVGVGARSLTVRGLDAIDGTPVLDLKPWHAWSGPRGPVRAPRWSAELGEEYF
jgi:tRNA (adenine37-N6)-methyltransferase